MRKPRIPPLLIDLVHVGLYALDGVAFNDLSACTKCGGNLSGYDTKKKQFAVLFDEGKKKNISVFVKRFYCQKCGALCYAQEPFYPNTRVGSPIVDLCVIFSVTMPYTRAATYLTQMGIIIDRGSVRNYARMGFSNIETTEIFGIRLPMSILTLSTLAARIDKGGSIIGAEALVACGFPSAYRTPVDPLFSLKKRNERDK
jgi:hypothetical protein